VNLAAGTVAGDPVFTGNDTLRSIEAIRGTHKDDLYDARGFSSFSTNAGSLGTLNEFEGMAGNDTIYGNGNTRLTFGNAREGVTVDLAAGTVTGGASVGNDTLMGGINQLRGSNFDDVLMGSNHGIGFAEVYEGRAGNDTFSGRGGFDQARYDAHATQSGIAVSMAAINPFTGTVVGDAGVGTDTLIDIVSVVGTWFDDVYDGTGYFSAVSGLASFNEFEGLGGNDTITGNGSTRVSYISSWDSVTVDLGAGTASGLAVGNDTLINVFNVRGSNFDDTLLGSAGNDTFEGRGGNDFIDGRDGFDLVRYDNGSNGPGSFIANAAGGFSASAGGHQTDTLVNIESIRGTNFGDLFDGSASTAGYTFDARGGDDTLIGSQGNDVLLGGDGNDLLRGGLGFDFLDGGAGSDTFDFDRLEEAGDTIANFQLGAGGDVLDIADLLAFSTSYAGGAGGTLEQFVRLHTESADALLQIDPDGSGFQDWQTLAALLGHAGLALGTLQSDGNLDTLI
jgi:Ca2+-binding RTX toxin-like protein